MQGANAAPKGSIAVLFYVRALSHNCNGFGFSNVLDKPAFAVFSLKAMLVIELSGYQD